MLQTSMLIFTETKVEARIQCFVFFKSHWCQLNLMWYIEENLSDRLKNKLTKKTWIADQSECKAGTDQREMCL